MKLKFLVEGDVKMPLLRQKTLLQWMTQVADDLGKKLGCITYKFTDDEGILEANKRFLDHDYYTDILTFDIASEGSSLLIGDILISLETVSSNAEKFGATFEHELHRVIIHGLLHLSGIDDKTPEEEQLMHLAEDKALTLLARLLKGAPMLSETMTHFERLSK